MNSSFRNMGYGLIFAVVLVYLLMVVNFQSWLDPMIILMALPGALAGILWMLFITQTTISVPALMGAIMSIGVATANSILMITFANDQRKEGRNAHDAALDAGMTRLRPVIMTALAMIIGMLPMSLGLGEGGEQNAPLAPGRDRRPCDGDLRHVVLRTDRLHAHSHGASAQGHREGVAINGPANVGSAENAGAGSRGRGSWNPRRDSVGRFASPA